MGMHMSGRISMSIGPFTRICRELGLPTPEVDDEVYCATVTEELYRTYENKAMDITEKSSLTWTEHRFLMCWEIMYAKRIEWLMDNDNEDMPPWHDLYFG